MKLSTLAAMMLVASAPLYAQQNDEKVYNLPVSDPNSPVMLELDIRHGKILVQGGTNENIEVIARTRPLDQEELKNWVKFTYFLDYIWRQCLVETTKHDEKSLRIMDLERNLDIFK